MSIQTRPLVRAPRRLDATQLDRRLKDRLPAKLNPREPSSAARTRLTSTSAAATFPALPGAIASDTVRTTNASDLTAHWMSPAY